MKQITDRRRPDALAQLKTAQETLAVGRRELAKAQLKMNRAQVLINESAQVLRVTFQRKAR